MPPADAAPPAPSSGHRSTRAIPRALLIVAIVLLLARIGAALWERAHPPTAQDLVNWRPIPAAESEARAAGRPILYDFSAEWCGPCQRMDEEVFRHQAGARRLNEMVVAVHVVDRMREDGRNAPEVDALQKRFKVEAFPTLVLYEPRTKRHETLVGYPGRDELLRDVGRKVARLKMAASFGDSS
jgi:thiol:disulfide interchange protein